MRGRPAKTLVACLGAVFALAAAPAGTAKYSAVQATGTEYHIALSRTHVAPGRVSVEFVNRGQDDHDLAITRKGGSTKQTDVVHPGDRATLKIRAKRGTYVLWCTLADHKSRGMRAVLHVRG